jgi:hypothetical protein
MSENNTLLQKADLALSDLSSNGGLLSPEQGDTFVRRLIKRYKALVTDGYDADRSGGHASTGHNVTGMAVDFVPGSGGSWAKINDMVNDDNACRKLLEVLKQRYAKRPSGFTRMTPVGQRFGDGALMVDLSLVDAAAPVVAEEEAPKAAKKTSTKKSA